ncbi:MAG: RsmB/NOP family class I SAM-dependent RNA methyltransferase, partial [Rhodomicrobium sp.]
TGQIYAYDSDPIRFRPIFERLKRAGARNVQTLPPGQEAALEALSEKMDLVLIDAPCSGSGVWRRRPDSKWRLITQQLAARVGVQQELLEKGAGLVKAGGTIAYVTCSVLPEENEDQAEAFLAKHAEFSATDAFEGPGKVLSRPLRPQLQRKGLQLTPAQHGTDGFYVALLKKNATS